jgi:hypothetical protein
MWARLHEGWFSCGLVFTWFMTETASVWRLPGLRTQKIRKLDNWDIYDEPLDQQLFWEVTLKIQDCTTQCSRHVFWQKRSHDTDLERHQKTGSEEKSCRTNRQGQGGPTPIFFLYARGNSVLIRHVAFSSKIILIILPSTLKTASLYRT